MNRVCGRSGRENDAMLVEDVHRAMARCEVAFDGFVIVIVAT